MIREFKDRNISIAIRILKGTTLRQASTEYGLTTSRLHQITINTCKRYLLPKNNKAMDGNNHLKTARDLWKNGTLKYQDYT